MEIGMINVLNDIIGHCTALTKETYFLYFTINYIGKLYRYVLSSLYNIQAFAYNGVCMVDSPIFPKI